MEKDVMKSIQVNELAKKIRQCQHINIIDVREEIEVAAGKIPEAKHIPLGELADSLEKLDKNEHYYLICHSGGRSSTACDFLTEQGYDVINITGGMMAWQGEKE